MRLKKIYKSIRDFIIRFFNPTLTGTITLFVFGLATYLLLPLYNTVVDNTIVIYTDKYFNNTVELSAVYVIIIILSGVYLCRELLKVRYYSIRWSYIYSLFGVIVIWAYYRFINRVWHFENLFESVISYVDLLVLLGLAIIICAIIVNIKIYRRRYCRKNVNAVHEQENDEEEFLSLISDAPIKNVEYDNFSRNVFAVTLSKVVMELDVQNCSYSLAVTAPWGHGKTSFINLFEKAFENQSVIVVNFTPWLLNPDASITKAFYMLLANYLMGINRRIANLIKKYLDILDAKLNYGISNILDNESLNSIQDNISKSLKKLDERIVIIIDDIDRLSSEEILEVFRIIRGSANFSNVVFVSCFDKKYIEEALHDSSEALKKTYIEKFFQLEFSLPQYDKNGLRTNATNFAENWLKTRPEDLEIFKEYIKPSGSFFGSQDVMDYFDNPRQLLRWLNNLSMTYSALKGECHIGDLADIEFLKLLYPSIYHLISTEFDTYFIIEGGNLKLWNSKKSKKKYDWMPDNNKDIYESEAYNNLDSEKDKVTVKAILKRLTNGSNGFNIEQLRFSSAGFSKRYFFGILQKDEVPQKEFNRLINMSPDEMISEIQKKYLGCINSLILLCHTTSDKTPAQEESIVRMILYLASIYGDFAFNTIVFMQHLQRITDELNRREDVLYNLLVQSPLSNWVSFMFCRTHTDIFPIELKRDKRIFLTDEFMDKVQLLCQKKAIESHLSFDNIRTVYSNCCYNFKSDKEGEYDTLPAKKEIDCIMRKYIIEHFSDLLTYLYYKDDRYDSGPIRYGITFPFNVLWDTWSDFITEAQNMGFVFQDTAKLNELGSLYDQCKNGVDSVQFDLKALDKE